MHMNQSHHPISDELLSAYIDGDVTEEERKQIEFAIATDPEIAWQVETLRQTVDLLQDLPPVPLPRSFVIREEQVADVLAARRNPNNAPAHAVTAPPTVTQRFWAFLGSGNLVLRNASAVAALLFLILIVGEPYLPSPVPAGQPAPAMVMEQAAAPAAEPQELSARSLPTATLQQDEVARTPVAPAALPESEEVASVRHRAIDQVTEPVQEGGAAGDPAVVDSGGEIEESAMAAMGAMALPDDDSEAEMHTEADAGAAAFSATAARRLPGSEEAMSGDQAEELPAELEAEKMTAMPTQAPEVPEDARPEAITALPAPQAQDPEPQVGPLTDDLPEETVVMEEDQAWLADEPVENTVWGMWRTLQLGSLLLATILVLLWIGSHRRSTRSQHRR
jgi:anti-sigma factor RsiW